MAKVCKKCKLQYNDNIHFCTKCGSPAEFMKSIQTPVQDSSVATQQPLVQHTRVTPTVAKTSKIVIGIVVAVVSIAILVCGILIIPGLLNSDEKNSIFPGHKNGISTNGLNLTPKFPGNTLCMADNHIVAVKSNGTVISSSPNASADCGQADVSDWTDIIAVSGGTFHTVGLKSDGTVVSTIIKTTAAYPEHGQTNVSDWTDITAISAKSNHTVGLKKDGTVLAVGCNEHGECEVSGWTDIASVIADDHYTIGIKTDGSVVVAGQLGFDIDGWTDVVDINTDCYDYAIGLKSDGTLVIDEIKGSDVSKISGWTDIVAIDAFDKNLVVGLKSDGTLVMTDDNYFYTKDDISDWTDIVAFDASKSEIVALKSDGTVLYIGNSGVENWSDIKIP